MPTSIRAEKIELHQMYFFGVEIPEEGMMGESLPE